MILGLFFATSVKNDPVFCTFSRKDFFPDNEVINTLHHASFPDNSMKHSLKEDRMSPDLLQLNNFEETFLQNEF